MTHICVNKLTTIGSDNGLSSGRHQAIISTDAGILLIGQRTNLSKILIEIHTFSLKMHFKCRLGNGGYFSVCVKLQIYGFFTGPNPSHTPIATWTGTEYSGTTTTSEGPQMYVRFISDYTARKRGFNMTYTATGEGFTCICNALQPV